MTKRDAMDLARMFVSLYGAGISTADANALHRISMTLHRWHERECGDAGGCIERDETTERPYWHDAYSGRRWPIPDRETGARKRLAAIMTCYPTLRAYVQGDPRGCALYVLRPGDASVGEEDSGYSRGLPIW